MSENKCAHCGAITEDLHKFEAETEEGIPEFHLCRPCAHLLCEQLTQKVEPYLSTVGYGAVAHTKRVALVKNFIHQE